MIFEAGLTIFITFFAWFSGDDNGENKLGFKEEVVLSRFCVFIYMYYNNLREFISSRKICVCGKKLMITGRFALLQIYTREGTFEAKHLEKRLIFWPSLLLNFFLIKRCWKCSRGYFYGFSTQGKQSNGKLKVEYEETALENDFLLTSRKTG